MMKYLIYVDKFFYIYTVSISFSEIFPWVKSVKKIAWIAHGKGRVKSYTKVRTRKGVRFYEYITYSKRSY